MLSHLYGTEGGSVLCRSRLTRITSVFYFLLVSGKDSQGFLTTIRWGLSDFFLQLFCKHSIYNDSIAARICCILYECLVASHLSIITTKCKNVISSTILLTIIIKRILHHNTEGDFNELLVIWKLMPVPWYAHVYTKDTINCR